MLHVNTGKATLRFLSVGNKEVLSVQLHVNFTVLVHHVEAFTVKQHLIFVLSLLEVFQ